MIVQQKSYRTIWFKDNLSDIICIIDQRYLPHQFIIEELATFDEMLTAVNEMHVRGAGLIGAAAGYGMYLATLEAARGNSFEEMLQKSAARLNASRPTAVNLSRAIDIQLKVISKGLSISEKRALARETAIAIADEDANYCKNIGHHGFQIISAISKKEW